MSFQIRQQRHQCNKHKIQLSSGNNYNEVSFIKWILSIGFFYSMWMKKKCEKTLVLVQSIELALKCHISLQEAISTRFWVQLMLQLVGSFAFNSFFNDEFTVQCSFTVHLVHENANKSFSFAFSSLRFRRCDNFVQRILIFTYIQEINIHRLKMYLKWITVCLQT